MLRFFLFLPFFLASCAKPTTDRPTISLPELQAEITFQLKEDYRAKREKQDRITRIAVPLLIAGAPFCDKIGNSFGFSYFDFKILDPLNSIERKLFVDYYSDSRVGAEQPGVHPYVTEIYKGFGAEKAGLFKGDRIIEVDGKKVNSFYKIVTEDVPFTDKKIQKKKWKSSIDEVLASVGLQEKTKFKIKRSIEHEVYSDNDKGIRKTYKDTTLELFISPKTSCSNRVLFIEDGLVNAYTDGKNIAITSGMLGFASDEELAIVIAHELAHCTEKHIRKKEVNSWMGTLAGAFFDAAVEVGLGIRTYNRYSNRATEAGALAFSQSFELEADYVGLYILARAGFSTEKAANFWRRMAKKSPSESNSMTGTHPSTAERYLLLHKTHQEISEKIRKGEPLIPNRVD